MVSIARKGGGNPHKTNPGPTRVRSTRPGAKGRAAQDGTVDAKATKREREGTAGSRSLSTVPAKSGNQPEGPAGGRGEPGYRTTGGKDAGNTESRQHLNETTTDSRTGEESTGAGVHDAGPSHRHRAAARSLSENPEGRCDPE